MKRDRFESLKLLISVAVGHFVTMLQACNQRFSSFTSNCDIIHT